MKKNYDAVLFDFDGTLADTGEGIFESVRYAVEALGKPPLSDKQLRSFIGPPIYDSFMNMLDLDHSSVFSVQASDILYRNIREQRVLFRRNRR